MAVVPTPMVIEVLDTAGLPLSGTPVRFASGPPAGAPPDPRAPYVLIGTVGGTPVDTVLETVTDAAGRAGVRLQLGPFAGEAAVRVTVPLHQLADTVAFSVMAASPTAVAVTPPDTMVTIDGLYSVSANLVDAYGNSVNQQVTLRVLTPMTISLIDGQVRGDAPGRGEFEARVGQLADTGRVSVVPSGTIAVLSTGACVPAPALRVFNTDGTNSQCLETPMVGDRAPFWSPAGDHLVYHAGDAGLRLHTTTLGGFVRRLFTYDVGIAEELWPHYSRDGAWIYYTARPQGLGDQSEIWRVHADGSGAERIGPEVAATDTHASPSPDGTRVAFATNRNGDFNIGIIEVATSDFTLLAVRGLTPRWSPQGDLIAFWSDNTIQVMTPDGTGLRAISNEPGYDAGLDWSPDGNWIVATAFGGRIDFIEVATGVTVSLTTIFGIQPTWRP